MPADYIPALRYQTLTPFYDVVTRLTTREGTVKQALLAQADIQPGHNVLDIGCGTGTLTIAAQHHQPVAQIFGLDGDPAILKIATNRRAHSDATTFTEALSYDLPFTTQSFDRVLCSLFFHHLQPDAKAATLTEVHRILRPNGQLHIADWGAATGPITRALFKPVQKLDGFSNTVDHVEGRLPRYLTQAGFEQIEIRRSFHTVFGVLSLFSANGEHQA